MNILEQAINLAGAGIASIPVKRDKTPALASWAQYRKKLPTEAELRRWFPDGYQGGIAALAGRLFCIDIDQKYAPQGVDLFADYTKKCADAGLGALLARVIVQKTPTGGYHLVFLCADKMRRNEKFARNEKGEVLFESRGEGGYFLVAPSPGYTVVSGDWEFPPTLSAEQRDALISVAQTFDVPVVRDESAAAPVQSARAGLTPMDDYDGRGDVAQVLRDHGWVSFDGKHWRRPGKATGFSATLGLCPNFPNRFYVFSTSTEFTSGKVYKPSAVYAMLEHGGDFHAAASALARQGYGEARRAQANYDGLKLGGPDLRPPDEKGMELLPASLDTADGLPPIYSLDEEEAQEWQRPQEIVGGVLYRGAKMMIAGPSKARKTYLLTDLAVSVAAGVPWLGFATVQAPVLYLNLELQDFAFRDRRREIVKAKVADGVSPSLFTWHLRGFATTFDRARARILAVCREEGIGMLIIDPTYKINQDGADENSAADVGRWLNALEHLGHEAGVAIVWSHHFAKGNASAKEAIDRASGSGVWARDPDALLMMTPHEQEDCMVLESSLRNFKPVDPFVIRWKYPIWERDVFEDPQALKKPASAEKKKGRGELDLDALPNVLKQQFGGVLNRENQAKVAEAMGCSVATLWRRWKKFKSLEDNDL